MKVYVVYLEDYFNEEFAVYGVYSSEEKAKECIEKMQDERVCYTEFVIDT